MPEAMPLGDILSITTGRLVSRDHIDGVYRILGHMVGEDLMTHQLPAASRECKPALLAQHPQLADINTPRFEGKDHVYSWLDEQEAIYGTHLDVEPLAVAVGDYANPLAMLPEGKPVIVVGVDR